MKTLKRIFPGYFLTGLMLMCMLPGQGQFSASKANNGALCNIGTYVSAGPDATSCDNSPFITQGSHNLDNGLAIWKTSGDGSFNNVYNLNSFYTPGIEDRKAGVVVLTLTYIFGGPEGGMVHDDMILHLVPCIGYSEINGM